MGIYYILMAVLWGGILVMWQQNKYKYDKKFFIFIAVVLVGMVAFRDKNVGMDTMNYLYYFNNPYRGYTDGRTIDEMEPAYTALNFLLAYISRSSMFFIFTTSLLTMIPMMVGIYKYSPFRTLSLFLLLTAGTLLSFSVYYFSMIRQCLAISCLYIAIYMLYTNGQKYNLKVMFWIILGVCFHFSSIAALPFFFICKINLRVKPYLIMLAVSCVIAVFANMLSLSTYVDAILVLTGRDVGFYFDSTMVEGSNWMAFIPLSMVALFVHLYASETTRNNIFVKSFSYGVLLNNVFSQLMPTNSDRFVLFYIISLIWVLPIIVRDKAIPHKLRTGLLLVCCAYFTYKFDVVLNYYVSVSQYINGIAPYKSILF